MTSHSERSRDVDTIAPDITYRKKIADELSLVLCNAEEPFLLLDPAFDILCYNEAFYQFYLAYSGAAIENGENMMRYVAPAFTEPTIRIYNRALQGEVVFHDIVVNERTFTIKHKPALSAARSIMGIFITIEDITARTNALQQMIINEKRYRSLIENGADGVAIFDINGTPFYVSPATSRILGYSESEALQLDLFTLSHPDDLANVKSAWKYVLDNPGVPVIASSSRLMHKDGTYRWLEGTLTNMLHDPAIAGIMDNFRDITDKVQSRKEISERQRLAELAEANYREIFEKANEGIFICELDTWKLVDLNRKTCDILGRSKEDVFSAHPSSFMSNIPGYSLNILMVKMKQAAVQGPQLFEWICRHKDGQLNWLEVNLQRASIAGADQILGFIRLINKRKKAEAQSEFERRDKEALINTTEDLIWSIDAQFRLIAANRAFIAALKSQVGVSFRPGDLVVLDDKYPVDFLNFWRSLYKRALLGESFIKEIFTPARAGLPESWAEVRFNPIFDHEVITGVACYSRDTTASKAINSKLIDTIKKLATAQQIAQIGYWKQDIAGGSLYWSDEVYKIWEISPDDFVPSLVKFFDTIHEDDRMVFVAAQEKIIECKTNLDIEFRICVNDKLKYVHVSGECTFDDAGTCTGIEGMVQDITERKNAELQLHELNQHLQEQANKLATTNTELEHFAYIASHDLQEPLRMVTSFLTMLEKKYKEKLDDQARQYINFAVDGAKRMRQIILDLLDFSRAGRIDDDPEEIDLNELVASIKPLLLQVNPGSAGAAINVIGKLPVINSYRTSLHQVFQNLVGNAMKYTRDGVAPEISIQAFNHFSQWQFNITDNGIGIDPEYYDKIFVIFQRLHNRTLYPGTGIGLAITKKIVENLGGEIWVQSVPGSGSTFSFTIEKI